VKCIQLGLLALALSVACSDSRPVFDPATMDRPLGPGPAATLWEGSFVSEGERLNAIAYEARGPGPHPTIILLHGFPGNERNLDLAQAFRRAGWNVVFFHYRGAWGSEGSFSFSGALTDVMAVTDAISRPEWARTHRVDPARITLVGHSMGGFLALAAGSLSPEIHCVISIAGPNLTALIPPDASPATIEQIGARFQKWARGRLVGATGPALMSDLIEHRAALNLVELAPGLDHKPVLLLAGQSDQVVPLELIQALYENYRKAGNPDIELITLEGDHSFSEQRIELAQIATRFLDRRCRE
jgi:pimeloyl-ACP methyl ester carboxylesterase